MKIQVSRPVLTEKTLALAATGWYTFAVPVDMEKESIGKAINSLYNVTVMQVRTARQHGKVRRGGRLRHHRRIANGVGQLDFCQYDECHRTDK